MTSLINEFDRQWEHGLVPDVGAFISLHSPLSHAKLIHLLLVDQSRRWANGEKPSAKDYFNRFPEILENSEGAIDLLFAEFLLREESDPTISVENFAERYPQFADEFRRQIEFHRTVGAELLHEDSDGEVPAGTSPGGIAKNEVPGYEILGELGRGGLGVVYLARNLQLNRKVALKMLLAGRFASNNLLKRLLLEAEATARLQHPNIVQIYEVGQHDGHPFLALEYIRGGTLAEWMERRPQSPRDAASIIRQIALAIQFAHENGVIHRDLKPSNLLIQALPQARTSVGSIDSSESSRSRLSAARLSSSELHIKIADFGLAKFVQEDATEPRLPATMTGDLMGTAAYMSPEQAQGGRTQGGTTQLTASTDIYSLGAILYELLTGRPPFMGVQPLEVLGQVIADEPIRPSQLVRHIPKDLQTICLKCLEKSPARRYASAAALADDLQRFLSNQPIVARHTMMLERGWRWCRRNPVKTTLTALVASVLLMVASVSGVYSIMLGNQLAITSKSEITEKSLKIQALDQLWESNIAQADALRTSRQVGQRFESLKAIETARALGNAIQFGPSQIDRMRNATVAALALPDMGIEERLKKPWPESVYLHSFDNSLSVCTYLKSPNLAIVQRISDGKVVARMEYIAPESALVLSPDGTKLAIFHDQCRVYQLDTASFEPVFESTSGGPWAFNSDGTQLIGIDGSGEMKVVSLRSPQSIRVVGKFDVQKRMSISPDSRHAAMVIDDSIQVVNLDSGNVILRVPAPSLPSYQCFAWHPNSKILAVRTDKSGIALFDIVGGERLKSIGPQGLSGFVFDANGNRLLTYDFWSENLQLWDVISGEKEFSQKGLHFEWIAAAPAGGFNLIQSLDSETISRVNISCPSVYQTIPALRRDSAPYGATDLSFSRDGRFLAYSSRNEVEIFDANSMTSLVQTMMPGVFVRFCPDGSLVSSNEFGTDEQGFIKRGLNHWRLIESVDQNSTTHVALGPAKQIDILRTEFAPAPFELATDGKMIAVCDYNGVFMWSMEKDKFIRTKTPHRDVRRVSISPDGKQVASGGWNGGNVCIWDSENGKLLHTIADPSQCTVQFSPDGKLLATNGREINVWDTRSWARLYAVKVLGKPNSGVSVCFSPDSKTLAASDSFGRIHLIDSNTGQEFLLLTGPTEKQLNGLFYSPDGKQLAAIPGSDTAHVWHLDAIQMELDERKLGWQVDDGNSPLRLGSSATGPRTIAITEDTQLPRVEFVFDERFRQVEAGQHIVQADIAAARFEFDSARASIKRALALNPTNPQDCNNLAWLLATGPMQLRDPQKAAELAQYAIQNCTEKERSVYANTLGVALYRAGKFDDALKMLKESLENQAPESQSFDLYFLSMCSSKLGDRTAARDYFERAQSLSGQFRAKLAFAQQMELDEFFREAQSLLSDAEL